MLHRKGEVINQAETEAAVSQYVNSVGRQHPGIRYMRLMIDQYTVEGLHVAHHCLLFDPFRMTLPTCAISLQKGPLRTAICNKVCSWYYLL